MLSILGFEYILVPKNLLQSYMIISDTNRELTFDDLT